MTTPRFPGSRLVDHPPHLMRNLLAMRADQRGQRDLTRTDILVFTASDFTRGVPCTSATMINTHETLVYRCGVILYADVACGTSAASAMEAQLAVPDLGVTGDPVASASGGTEQVVRLTLTLPDAWDMGDAHLVFVQARRTSGSDATTMRVLRAWQR